MRPRAEPQQTQSPQSQTGDEAEEKICKIPVKIFVDDEEPFVRKRWEERLRSRIERASDILEQHCRVRFEIVAFDTWDSDNDELNFAKMLAEFEREIARGTGGVGDRL